MADKKQKTFTVTQGTVFQKKGEVMHPYRKGDKVKLHVNEDGDPIQVGIRSQVEGRKKAPLKEGEDNDKKGGK